MIGRRVEAVDELEHAGDYCRTTVDVASTGAVEQTMFFVMPNAPEGRKFGWIARICFPPHVERECADGSLEVRESILVLHGSLPGWHGYLDEGHVWREC